VRHRAAPSFWQEYNALDEDVRKIADKSFEILKNDPQHPSLHLKKTGRFWSARVGLHHRALSVEIPDGLLCSGLAITTGTTGLLANSGLHDFQFD
jgi:hypothetical protein